MLLNCIPESKLVQDTEKGDGFLQSEFYHHYT